MLGAIFEGEVVRPRSRCVTGCSAGGTSAPRVPAMRYSFQGIEKLRWVKALWREFVYARGGRKER